MVELAERSGIPAWLFFALLSAIFAAATNIFAKIGVADVNSNLATWIRVIVIFVVLSGIIVMRGEWVSPQNISSRTWIFLILSGLATGASWLCYFRAIQIGEIALVAPIDKLSVVLVMLMGALFLREALSLKQWAGGALILAGVLLIAWPNSKPAAEKPASAATGA
jgi:transporter family protein